MLVYIDAKRKSQYKDLQVKNALHGRAELQTFENCIKQVLHHVNSQHNKTEFKSSSNAEAEVGYM